MSPIATVREAGGSFDDVVPEGVRLRVRRTANLHQGGTIHDVSADVNPELCSVAVTAADAIGIPVTGIDLLVPDVVGTDYVFIEANERPGLAKPRAAAHRTGFRRLPVPGESRPAAGVDAGPGAAVTPTSCWCATRSRRPTARWTPCALRLPSRSTSRKSPYT